MPAVTYFDLFANATADETETRFGISASDFLAFFAEYSLLVSIREIGTEVDLGYNHLPTFGVSIYFN